VRPEFFIGKQDCSSDDKRRFSLPPKFRPLFDMQETPSGHTYHLVLIPWYGGSIAAFPVSRWKEIESRMLTLEYTTPEFLEAKRRCLPRMEFVHTDPEGRLQLTPDLHAWLRLKERGKDRVSVVGMGQHLEIWNGAEWEEVEHTGKNPATRAAADVDYDRLLEVLMAAAKDAAAEAARVVPPGDPEGQTQV
jgi:division/cell wall cluster transcriptional repressor MraZ